MDRRRKGRQKQRRRNKLRGEESLKEKTYMERDKEAKRTE
jgi:hypothetical protein